MLKCFWNLQAEVSMNVAGRSHRRVAAVSACAFLVILIVAACGSDASARPTSWKPFCAQLAAIKKTSETPGGWNKEPNDPYGLKAFAADYDNAVRLAPSSAVATSLKTARPLFSGPVRYTKAIKKNAVPAARSLVPVVARQCNLQVGDVFKVGF